MVNVRYLRSSRGVNNLLQMTTKKLCQSRLQQTTILFIIFPTFRKKMRHDTNNAFNVYCRELAPSTVSLTGDRAQGDDSKY